VTAAHWPGPCREFAPAGDLLSCADKKVGKETAPVPSPLRCAAGSPAMLATRGSRRTRFATRRSNSCAKSVHEVRFAHASGCCASRLLQGGAPKQPTAQQPTAKPESRSPRGISIPPSEPAEKHRALSPRAKLASTTDSRRLFEQSVASRVRRAGSRTEHRREPEAQRRAGGSGAVSLVTFLGAQESDSPAGAKTEGFAKSPLGLGINPPLNGQPT
jgi:hypothetical protein